MVQLLVRNFSQIEWTEIVSGFQDLSLLQTWEFGEAKAQSSQWSVQRSIVLNNSGAIVSAAQMMVRQIPVISRGMIWINRGPLSKSRISSGRRQGVWPTHLDLGACQKQSSGEEIQGLLDTLDTLRQYWVDARHMYLRIALPTHQGQLNSDRFYTLGYQPAGYPGWASARLDLTQSLERLRSHLHQKWRNALNKSERLGLGIEIGTNNALFDIFLSEYKQLLLRRAFETNVTPQMLKRLQSLLPEERKGLVLVARNGGVILGSILVARYGDTCEYLAATIRREGRASNAGYSLIWNAICAAKNMGYRWFDLGGLDHQHTPPGIFHFKTGLGSASYRLMDELESRNMDLISQLIRWRARKARREASN